jgi:flagellin-like protein
MTLELFKEQERGVSPVVATVLMIGVVVVLGAGVLAGGSQFLNGFGENPSGQVTFDVNSEGNVEILISDLHQDVNDVNVKVQGEDPAYVDGGIEAETGSVAEINNGTGTGEVEPGDRIIVTAETDNNDGTIGDFTYPESG